jgi:hypothetical protein
MSQTKSQLIEGSAASELTAAKTLLGAGSAGAPSLTATGDTNTGIFFPTADTIAQIGTVPAWATCFYTNNAERARLDSSGAFMVGCTVRPSSGNVTGVFSEPGIITIGSTTSAGQDRMRFETPSGRVGSISTSGSGTAYNTSSDYRLKENVTPVTDGIVRLQQLKPSRFNFIVDPDKTVDGFIAHEAQAVVPECVTGEKDAVDDDGNPEYQGIDQSKLVPLLTAALQEAVAEIKALKDRVTALESA